MHKARWNNTHLSAKLLAWYREHGRELPWRKLTDPYKIWISEIMLQQTRVETAIPYFESWMQTFPTLSALAQASEQEVLNAWEGLGYYSRARNLLRAARMVLEEFGGELPRDVQALRSLPGIGRYTAGAIASIAFGLDEPALDANLKRCYARLFDIGIPANTPSGERILWQIARENIPVGQAGEFNQALMDLGASICTPKHPACMRCPIRIHCRSYSSGVQDERPVMKPKKAVPHFIHAAAVILQGDRVLLAKRPAKGLLGGMWAFPAGRIDALEDTAFESLLKREYKLTVRRMTALKSVHHAYTHFKVTVRPFLCELISANGQEDLLWVDFNKLDEYPMGKVDRTIARFLQQI
jgi:A/G-specific adenine glycosylase